MCRDWVTQVGCNRGQACRFAHPPGQGRLGAGKDCSFWLAGDCRYAPGYCNRGAHVEGKKGSKLYRQAAGQKQDFGQPPTTFQGPVVDKPALTLGILVSLLWF